MAGDVVAPFPKVAPHSLADLSEAERRCNNLAGVLPGRPVPFAGRSGNPLVFVELLA